MIKQLFTRFITALALFAASVAWSAWAYLHTVADPHRIELVATEVLADADARLELADPLADQIVELAGLDPSAQPELRDAVVAVMADQRIAANLTSAVGAAHARSFGVPDTRPAVIDGNLLVAAVREHLAGASPALAERVPSDLVGEITVPEHRLPFASGLRRIASFVIEWFGAAAIGLLTFSFLAGDRAGTLRRFGWWAISAGLAWAVGPRLVVFVARRFLPDIDAILAAGVGAATRTVTFAATGLVVVGIGAVVGARALALVPAGGSTRRAGRAAPPPRTPRREDRPVSSVTPIRPVPSPPVAPPPVTPPVAPTTVLPSSPVLPAAPSAATTVLPVVPSGPFEATSLPPTPPSSPTVRIVAGDLPISVPPTPPAPEVDPWALFAGPAVDPATGEALPRRPETPGAGS